MSARISSTFGRSKTSGAKFYFPQGTSGPCIAARDLPTHPQFSAVRVQCETCATIASAATMHAHATGLQCTECREPAKVTPAFIDELKAAGQDFEFYPTTDEIIAKVLGHLKTANYVSSGSVLDIGAGSGKVLAAFGKAGFDKLYAIEKAELHLQRLPASVMIVGTDFIEQTLLNKAADVTFCNPPYSQFETWAEKIIRETASPHVYLVIPQRWSTSQRIADALAYRETTAKVIGSFDFASAEERTARAKVDVLHIRPDFKDYSAKDWRYSRCESNDTDKAFARQFHHDFAEFIAKFEGKAATVEGEAPRNEDEENLASLVPGEDYAARLVALYNQQMAKIRRNYELVTQLDLGLMREFDISPSRVLGCLKARLSGLRQLYWSELFKRLDKITSRLTSKTRQQMLNQLNQQVHVDFTLPNIHAVVLWAIKNVNAHQENQFCDCYEVLVDKCNVRFYKSNQRTWQADGWRYTRSKSNNTHFALDFRIITHRVGGIGNYSYSYSRNTLRDSACEFISDLRTIANNLGFTTSHDAAASQRSWTSGTKEFFSYRHHKTGKDETLFEVRAFQNGNLHFRMNQTFMLALNVEYGRLRGWLKSGKHAADELGKPEAARFFNSLPALPNTAPLHQFLM